MMLAIDLFCGLGGWTEGLLAEGYQVIGFDIERWAYPGMLCLQDVRTLHGSQFKDATVIVASPPCQAYSYRAMPWKRAKALPPPSNELFEACFRIQREACEAAGHYIPLVVENVCGAQRWVGKAKWHFGSYYLWGDVPALMPSYCGPRLWKDRAVPCLNDGESFLKAASRDCGAEGVKVGGARGDDWFVHHNTSEFFLRTGADSRKAASAMIAKIPFVLAQHIAKCFKPTSMGPVAIRGE